MTRVPVIIKTPSGYVPHVNAKTRRATEKPQQFRLAEDGSLTPLRPREWIASPNVVDVGSIRYS